MAVVAAYCFVSHPVWSVVADGDLLGRILLIGVAVLSERKRVTTRYLSIKAVAVLVATREVVHGRVQYFSLARGRSHHRDTVQRKIY